MSICVFDCPVAFILHLHEKTLLTNNFGEKAQIRDVYADFAQVLIHIARDLYKNDEFCIELDQTVYALDSTTIDLCLFSLSVGAIEKAKRRYKVAYAH